MPEYTRFAILSHILPPAWSGQAVVLYRLLNGVPAEEYCLITDGQESGNATLSLPARLWRLKKPLKGWGYLAAISPLLAERVARWQIGRRAAEIEGILRSERCTVLVACSGDLLDIPAGAIAAKRVGASFIPYLFDDYLYQWTGWQRRVANVMERMAMMDAAGAIVPNEFLYDEYNRRYKVTCTVIHNPVNLPDLKSLDAETLSNRTGTAIVYTGAIYHAHYDAFRNLLAAMNLLDTPDLKLHIYTAQSQAELQANGICGPRVMIRPHIPQQEVLRIQRSADILFLPLAFDSRIPEVIRTSAPGKMGEYLAAGRPILAHVPAGTFVGWYLNQNSCGVVVDRKEPEILAEAIMQIITDDPLRRYIGERARERAETDFDVRVAQGQFRDFLRDMDTRK